MSELRDFLYLDTAKLHSFVSQIHGGLISEINETIKRLGGLSAGVEIGLPPFGGKVGASKGKESEREQTIQLTDPAYFGVLYQYLKTEKKIESITASSLQERENLSEGQFVEMRGIAEPPVVEYWIARVRALVDFLDKNLNLIARTQTARKGKSRKHQLLPKRQMDLFKQMVDFLEDYINISRRDPGKQYIRISGEEPVYNVWSGLLPDFIVVPIQAILPVEVYIVGRVERLLDEGDVYKIVDFSQFSQASDIDKLLDALNALGPLIGQARINETDLQAQHPDIFVTPIAIYR